MDTEQALPQALSFSQLLDRGLALPPARALWCPTMDLLAVLTSDGQLQLYRLNWQRLWSITPESPITSLCWRPDGKQIAVGQHDGCVLLLNTEDGETQERAKIFDNPVDAITWTFSSSKTSPGQPIVPCADRTRSFFEPPLPPAPAHAAPTSAGFDNYNERLGKREEASWPPKLDVMDLIACGSSIGELALCGEGLFLLAKHRVFASKTIHQMAIPPSLAEVAIRWVTDAGDEVLSLVDTSFLAGPAQHTLRLLCSYAADTTRGVRTCRTIIWQMWKEWQNVQTAINGFKSTLNELLKQHGVESDAQSDLLLLVTMGEYTPPMEQFLMNALGEGGIKKVARGVDASLCAMHALLVDRLQPEMEMVAFRLGELRGVAANPMNRNLLNLHVSEVAKAERSALKILARLETLRNRVTTGVNHYRTFFSWLTTALRRFPEDTVDTMMGYPLSHVDTVRAFLHFEFQNSLIEPFLFVHDPNGPPEVHFSPEKEPIIDVHSVPPHTVIEEGYGYFADEVNELENYSQDDILTKIEITFQNRQALNADPHVSESREMALISKRMREHGTGMVKDVYALQNEVLIALVRPSIAMSTRLHNLRIPGRAENNTNWLFVRQDTTPGSSISSVSSIPGVLQYANGELMVAVPVEIPAAAGEEAGTHSKNKQQCLALMTCSAKQFSEDSIYLEPQVPTQEAMLAAAAGGHIEVPKLALDKAVTDFKGNSIDRKVKFMVIPFPEDRDIVDIGYYKNGALALLLENQREEALGGGGGRSGGDAILALLPRDYFEDTMLPVNVSDLNTSVPAFEAYGSHVAPSPLHLEGCRQRALPYKHSKRPMAISSTRGIAFVLTGNQRAILYDLEEDEEPEEEEEEQQEEEQGKGTPPGKSEIGGEGVVISEKELEEMSVSRMTRLLLGVNDQPPQQSPPSGNVGVAGDGSGGAGASQQ